MYELYKLSYKTAIKYGPEYIKDPYESPDDTMLLLYLIRLVTPNPNILKTKYTEFYICLFSTSANLGAKDGTWESGNVFRKKLTIVKFVDKKFEKILDFCLENYPPNDKDFKQMPWLKKFKQY